MFPPFPPITHAMTERAEIWAPLERFAGQHAEICPEDFMFMGKTGDGIFLYKHADTRRYLNLNTAGATFTYRGGYYWWIEDVTAIAHVLS